MSLEALIKELNEKHKKEIEALLKEYDQKKEEILKQANEEYNKILSQAQIQSKFVAERELVKRIGAAKLKVKRIMFEATQEMLQKNYQNLIEALKGYVNSEKYDDVLKAMLNYAKNKLGDDILIKCRLEDKAKIENYVKKSIKIEPDLNCLGGIIAIKSDQTAYLDLTFEEILRLNDEKVKSLIMEKT